MQGPAVTTSDLDIYRTASVLFREHGKDIDLIATQRADSFLGLPAWTTRLSREPANRACKVASSSVRAVVQAQATDLHGPDATWAMSGGE